MSNIGEQVRRHRRAMGLTAEQLADRADISMHTIRSIETGRTNPRMTTVRQIAVALNTSVEILLDDPDNLDETAEILAIWKSDLSQLDRAKILDYARYVAKQKNK